MNFYLPYFKKIKKCPKCDQEYDDYWQEHDHYSQERYYWTIYCKPCNSTRFKNEFDKWTSGNDTIDKFIQDTQLNASGLWKVTEWIPYNKFKGIKEIAIGGFVLTTCIVWIDGFIENWDIENEQWKRYSQREVVLKKIDSIGDLNENFLNEMVTNSRTMGTEKYEFEPVSLYGITKDPKTHKYMMVFEYIKDGNLRNYLNNNFNNIGWHKKLKYLRDLAQNFASIHNLNIIHQDFHPGNILSYNFNYSSSLRISDFGLSKLFGKNGEIFRKRTVFGVLPYIAPEVLGGEEYTKAADVYSFAIVAYEIITGLPPYPDVAHDNDLALRICNGLRPKIPFHTPKLIARMIMRCLDARVTHRPTFDKLSEELSKYFDDYSKRTSIIGIQIKEAEEFFKNQETTDMTTTLLNYKTYPQAIYTSRLLDFSNLPKPINEPNFETKLEELTESFSHINTNDDIENF
ncbi:hypothetical protein Glove_23g177 [Diversispora epigaea]|uniref:Protein kinase domain-containing protein n=1 Tax=Diversispora epigaea TaxID=1348612 RepID=A0A397JM01_9GLOM|nr:hypothetical protein Glove_23g177 [Diversispora epigaea]